MHSHKVLLAVIRQAAHRMQNNTGLVMDVLDESA